VRNNDRDPLLDQRAALILLFGMLSAIGTGALTVLNGGTPAGAGLGAGCAGVKRFLLRLQHRPS
jgi:hypothetical protein